LRNPSEGKQIYLAVFKDTNGALSWGPMSRFTRVARSKVSGQQMFFARKRSGSGKSTDVGHEGVITGRDALSLRSSIADPQGVVQPPLQSIYIHKAYVLKNVIHNFW